MNELAQHLPWWLSLPASLLLAGGGLLTLIGALGVLRFDNFFARMHAATLGTTLGAGGILLAYILVMSGLAHGLRLQGGLIAVLMLLTAPISAILLMQAGMQRSARQKPAQAANTPQASAAVASSKGTSSKSPRDSCTR
ncbi:MAG: monovalent cation/H(+) antiporter subunit G [Sterolibacterium sp.]|nr:monovalent cation/H(+) antiporter subunit G [Sterolibacterium sp.]